MMFKKGQNAVDKNLTFIHIMSLKPLFMGCCVQHEPLSTATGQPFKVIDYFLNWENLKSTRYSDTSVSAFSGKKLTSRKRHREVYLVNSKQLLNCCSVVCH